MGRSSRVITHVMLVDEYNEFYFGNTIDEIIKLYVNGSAERMLDILKLFSEFQSSDARMVLFFDDGSHVDSDNEHFGDLGVRMEVKIST